MKIYKPTAPVGAFQLKAHAKIVVLALVVGCSSAVCALDCDDRNDGFIWNPPTPRPTTAGQPPARHGANRVLHTPETARGGGVKATFTEPGFTIGTPWHQTKPSFYLGLKSGDARVTIDAGVQWEQGEWDDEGTARHGWWSFFMNVASQGCHSSWNPPGQLRVPQNELGSTTLTLQIHPGNTDGNIDFKASNFPVANLSERPVYWTKEPNGRVNISGMKGRRVIALTQEAGGPFYNNSSVSCSVSNGHMGLITYQNATSTSPILVWDRWGGPDHRDAKDYNPTGKAREGASSNESDEPWAVDFGTPFTRKRDNTGSHPSAAEIQSRVNGAQEVDRYAAESVGIQLLKAKAQLNRSSPPQPSGSG